MFGYDRLRNQEVSVMCGVLNYQELQQRLCVDDDNTQSIGQDNVMTCFMLVCSGVVRCTMFQFSQLPYYKVRVQVPKSKINCVK